jgi:hypothetical protein
VSAIHSIASVEVLPQFGWSKAALHFSRPSKRVWHGGDVRPVDLSEDFELPKDRFTEEQ